MGSKTNTDSGDSLGTSERAVFERMRARLRELEGDLAGRILHYEAQGIQLEENQPTLVCKSADAYFMLTKIPIRKKRRLAPRESQIAQLVSKGLTNSEIAEKLGISVSTVNEVVQRILKKLGAKKRTQIAVYALCTSPMTN